MKKKGSQKQARMPPDDSDRSRGPAKGRISLAPLWKLNYHTWVCLTWGLLLAGVLDMVFGWFPFVVHVNSIAVMLELAASAIVCHGAEAYLTRHRAPSWARDRFWYLVLVYMAVCMIWLNVFLDGLYWENGVTALVYLAGRTYLEKKGRSHENEKSGYRCRPASTMSLDTRSVFGGLRHFPVDKP